MAKPAPYIRPEAYRVADHLLGTPLARPLRRLGAMLVDLLLVGILVVLLDAVALVIALVAAWFVFRLTRSKSDRWYARMGMRGVGCFAALIVFVVAIAGVDMIGDWLGGDDDDGGGVSIQTDSASIDLEGLGLRAGLLTLVDGAALAQAERAGQRDTLADAIVERLVDEGMAPAHIRAAVLDLQRDAALTPAALLALAAAVETTTARLENRAPRSPDEVRAADSIGALAARDSASALAVAAAAAGDTALVDSALAAAHDSLVALRTELDATSAALAAERAENERLDAGAIRWVLSSVSDELGLGLGWLGAYFTACLVLGRGQTPGKRLFRLRVIRLDGKAIGWWTALQRFGGYSASVFTGLLGFAEMFWDENRQALQDKLVFTVVIQEPKKGEISADALDGRDARAMVRPAAPSWAELRTSHAVDAVAATPARPIRPASQPRQAPPPAPASAPPSAPPEPAREAEPPAPRPPDADAATDDDRLG